MTFKSETQNQLCLQKLEENFQIAFLFSVKTKNIHKDKIKEMQLATL